MKKHNITKIEEKKLFIFVVKRGRIIFVYLNIDDDKLISLDVKCYIIRYTCLYTRRYTITLCGI